MKYISLSNFYRDLLKDLALTISQDKLVPPSTSVVCLCIMVNTTKVSPMLNTDLLLQTVQACEALDHNIVYRGLYLFTYFSFLRMSDILPHSTSTYDYTRHMSRGDIIFSQIGATIIVKWS